MNHIEINSELRDFCRKLIEDGYSKPQICSLILGQQKQPMFSQFIDNDERNFGVAVLTQIFEAFGYDLKIVPVAKDQEMDPKLTEIYNVFLENYKVAMVQGLDSNTVRKTGNGGKVQKSIENIAANILEKLKGK